MKFFLVSVWYWIIKFFDIAKSKSFLCGLCLIVFLISLTLFYYKLATVPMMRADKDVWRDGTFLFGISFVFSFEWSGIETFFQKQFLNVCRCVILLTFIVKVLTPAMIVTKPYLYLLSLDIGTLFVTTIILILAVKHNILNE